jgi:hypothetical protein
METVKLFSTLHTMPLGDAGKTGVSHISHRPGDEAI